MRLKQQFRAEIVRRGHSVRTAEIYWRWIKDFLSYFGMERHPRDLGEAEIGEFMTSLATERELASSTQRQALNALAFLYKGVLRLELGELVFKASKRPKQLPTVLSENEVRAVLEHVGPQNQLAAKLLYGAGLRVGEVVKLRVKDLDFDARELVIREAKGAKDRVTIMPESLRDELGAQVDRVRAQWVSDTASDPPVAAPLPGALAKKKPSAPFELGWRWVFPSRSVNRDNPVKPLRWHRSTGAVQIAFKTALRKSGITKPATCHTLRHSFATHLLRSGTDIRTVQKLLGHTSVQTTMKYLHVLGRGAYGVRSPLDS